MLLDELHSHIANVLNRTNHNIDLALQTLSRHQSISQSTNTGPLIGKLEFIYNDLVSDISYIENNFSEKGPFSELVKEIKAKTYRLIAALEKYTQAENGSLLKQIELQVKTGEKKRLLSGQAKKLVKSTTPPSQGPGFNPELPPGIGTSGAVLLFLAIAFDMMQSYVWNKKK